MGGRDNSYAHIIISYYINAVTPGEDFYLPILTNSTEHGPDNSLCFDILVIEDEFVEYEECFEIGIY